MAINKSKLALVLGSFVALLHLIWSFFVAVFPGALQSYLNWVFKIHFLTPVYTITSFNFGNAILLVILTFIVGYIFGWLFATIWNLVVKK